jgi:hypothetical protein
MRTFCRLAVLPIAMLACFAGTSSHGQAHAQTILTLPDDAEPTARQPVSSSMKATMAGLRKLVLDNHTLITHRRFAPADARRMASEVQRSTAALRAEPATPALEKILAPLSEGAKHLSAPAAPDSQLDALAQLETAFDRYQTLFDDPDWKPLR